MGLFSIYFWTIVYGHFDALDVKKTRDNKDNKVADAPVTVTVAYAGTPALTPVAPAPTPILAPPTPMPTAPPPPPPVEMPVIKTID